MTRKTISSNERTIAIIGYITVIGWVIAFILNYKENSKFVAFHLRHGLFLVLLTAFGSIVRSLSELIWVIVLVYMVIGIVYVAHNKKKELPFIGTLVQDWFKGI